jgi:hypothetical protein
MKQFLLFALFFSTTLCLQAQGFADFEGLLEDPETVLDGSNGEAGYTNGPAYFPTTFDFGFWLGGWAISNVTDSITSGYTNIYGVKAASGYESETFAIGQNSAILNLLPAATNNSIEGVYITNSTYAYNSMRDGDGFAKKFGGSTGSDPDFFLLTIFGYSNGEIISDSVDFYLADYRFEDNTEDYILDTWKFVDLTSLGAVDSLTFSLSSTDNGVYGMNTPGFFCIDNLTVNVVSVFEQPQLTDVRVFPNPVKDILNIDLQSFDNEMVSIEIFNFNGQLMNVFSPTNEAFQSVSVRHLTAGNYVLKITSGDKIAVERVIVH